MYANFSELIEALHNHSHRLRWAVEKMRRKATLNWSLLKRVSSCDEQIWHHCLSSFGYGKEFFLCSNLPLHDRAVFDDWSWDVYVRGRTRQNRFQFSCRFAQPVDNRVIQFQEFYRILRFEIEERKRKRVHLWHFKVSHFADMKQPQIHKKTC